MHLPHAARVLPTCRHVETEEARVPSPLITAHQQATLVPLMIACGDQRETKRGGLEGRGRDGEGTGGTHWRTGVVATAEE